MRKITFIILLSTTLSLFATQKNDKEFIISGYLTILTVFVTSECLLMKTENLQ